MAFLYNLAVDPEVGVRSRFRGTIPSPALFDSTFWQGVLVQLLIWAKTENEPAGLLTAYNADLNSGFVYFGIVTASKFHHTRLPVESMALFLEYLFATWNLRKVYMEVPGYNYPQFKSGEGSVFSVEGILRDHDYLGGQYFDHYLLAIYRGFTPEPESRRVD